MHARERLRPKKGQEKAETLPDGTLLDETVLRLHQARFSARPQTMLEENG